MLDSLSVIPGRPKGEPGMTRRNRNTRIDAGSPRLLRRRDYLAAAASTAASVSIGSEKCSTRLDGLLLNSSRVTSGRE